MDRIDGFPKPSWANLVLAMAFFLGACISALVMDDSFQSQAEESLHQHE